MKALPMNGVTQAPTALKDYARFRRTQNRDVRIGGDFQNALAAGHHKQREQEKSVSPNRSGGDEQDRTNSARSQANQNAFSIADALHQPSRRERRQEISAKKSSLNQRRLEIAEVESLL